MYPRRHKAGSRPGRRRGCHLLALLLGLAPEPALAVSQVDDLCTGDPCIISSSFSIDPGAILDFGSRALILEKKLTLLPDALGLRSLTLRAGSLELRGSGVIDGNGGSLAGALIRIEVTGEIHVDSTTIAPALDASGVPGGSIFVSSTGGSVSASAKLRFKAKSGDSDGGSLTITAPGDITLSGNVIGPGGFQGTGGDLDLRAGGDITVSGDIDLSGGGGGGGLLDFSAGGSITMAAANLDGGGENGDGGSVALAATGPITLTAPVLARGSGAGVDLCGDGGDIDFFTLGDIAVLANVTVSARAGDCFGGFVALDGVTVTIDGAIELSGLGGDGFGGSLEIFASGPLLVRAPVRLDGGTGGAGDAFLSTTESAELLAPIEANARGALGSGAAPVEIEAARDLTIAADIDGRGGSGGFGGDVLLTACFLSVDPGVRIRADGDFASISLTASDSVVLQGIFSAGVGTVLSTIDLFYGVRADPPDVAGGSFTPPLTAVLDPTLVSCRGCLGPADCDDGNACTDDICLPDETCTNPADDTNACEDGDACSEGDFCSAGSCNAGPPLDCDDSNPCTADSCDAAVGCLNTPVAGSCEDGDPCTLGDSCDPFGACIPGPFLDCNDGNLCTDDLCDGLGGCLNPPNSLPCEDGSLCTTGDVCTGGVCEPGPPLDCDDGNLCTDDLCDPALGCQNPPNSLPCDDGDTCTTADVCSGGTCTGGPPLDCDDGNLCTDDLCDPALGCQNPPNNLPCDDGDTCTTADVCSGGACTGGPPLDCDDGDICSLDTCLPGTGCQNQAIPGCVNLDGDGKPDASDECTTLSWSQTPRFPPDQNPSRFSLSLKNLDRPGGHEIKAKGFFGVAAGGEPPDPAARGAHLWIEDDQGLLYELGVPAGSPGTGCGPEDGWRSSGRPGKRTWRYTNRSGALPPACAAGSARGLSKLQIRDLTATSKAALRFKLRARGMTLDRLPQRPVTRLRFSLTLADRPGPGQASVAAQTGQCAEARFEGDPVRIKSPKPFCKPKLSGGTFSALLCKGP